jgi:hypothetical protein
MKWNEYKRLCDSPQVFSRWMLEQCIELLGNDLRLRNLLARELGGRSLDKPRDHRGGTQTDMFEVALSLNDARAVHAIIGDAVREGRTTEQTGPRGLGGFEETWREYVAYRERIQNQGEETPK